MRLVIASLATALWLVIPACVLHDDAQTIPPSVTAPETHVFVPCKPSGEGNGHVTVHVHVNKDGAPSDEKVTKSSGDDCLDRKAVASVHATHFNPAMQNGHAVAVDLEIDINMHVDPPASSPTPNSTPTPKVN